MDSSRNGTCGRRMWVIHTLGVSSTLIHIATRFGTSQDITQRSTAQRTKGRPAEAGLPARIFGAESLHNNIVVTVSSIQCPFNVTTYLGHTHLVGLCSSVVLVLRNYARHCGKCKTETGRCSVFIATVAFRSQESQKMLHAVRIATLACSFHVHLPRKNGVSEAYFTNSANEC